MLDFFSLVTVPLKVLSIDGTVCGSGTGFLYRKKDSCIYLITNWHVVTGRKNTSPSLSNGCIPYSLTFELHRKIEGKEGAININNLEIVDIVINSEDGNNPEWLEHPVHKYKVDVVAFKIESKDTLNLENICIFNILKEFGGFDSKYLGYPMDDVFVIGYPWGLSGGGILPLYKRGSIASEPIINYLGLPMLLIDCRTAPSMSGAPVIANRHGPWHPDGTHESTGKLRADTQLNGAKNFIGVYSGRFHNVDKHSNELNKNEVEVSEIGIVWKQSAVDEIIENGVSGTKLDDLIS